MIERTLFRPLAIAGLLAATAWAAPARADRIVHPTAVFSGLDKITGRIISFEVATNETVQFGSLQITERACYTRPATEAPQTVTFAQVDEIDAKKQYKRIFSGWMFASSPGLNGIEHPVYDVWLTECKGGTEVQKAAPETVSTETPPPDNADAPATPQPDAKPPEHKRRVAKRRQPQPDDGSDVPVGATPQPDPSRQAPSRRFFPDAASGQDPGGFY